MMRSLVESMSNAGKSEVLYKTTHSSKSTSIPLQDLEDQRRIDHIVCKRERRVWSETEPVLNTFAFVAKGAILSALRRDPANTGRGCGGSDLRPAA
jgi:hypothetical protein